MPAISLIPQCNASVRLVASLGGSEWFEFEAALAPAMNIRFAPDGRTFPSSGTVSIRRGFDHAKSGERIVDSFRYIESCTDDETGEHVQERFGVTLFMAKTDFDRLMQRAHWGPPALVLSFDPSSEVITMDRSAGIDALWFRREPRSWEEIRSATLTQRPGAAAS